MTNFKGETAEDIAIAAFREIQRKARLRGQVFDVAMMNRAIHYANMCKFNKQDAQINDAASDLLIEASDLIESLTDRPDHAEELNDRIQTMIDSLTDRPEQAKNGQ
jgi:hypothetical protein